MLRSKFVVVASLLSLVVVSSATAATVVNSGFETNASDGNEYTTPFQTLDPTTGVSGWRLSSTAAAAPFTGAIKIIDSPYVNSGAAAISFDGNDAFVEQDLTLVAGTATVSFWLQQFDAFAVNPLKVSLGGVPLTFGGNPTVFPNDGTYFKAFTDPIAVSAGVHTLRFELTLGYADAGNPYITNLDDVGIDNVAVPEPTGIIAFGLGALGILAHRRSRLN